MGRSTRNLLIAALLFLVGAVALGDERQHHIQGLGGFVESDQTRMYHIPGYGAYTETLAAAAGGRRRQHVIGP